MRALPESERSAAAALSRDDLGFLLAKATQRWNELLAARFAAAGFADVRPSYGSVLLPLYEQDGLRMGELARRARLSKQTMTTMIPRLERDGLVERRPDPGTRGPSSSSSRRAVANSRRSRRRRCASSTSWRGVAWARSASQRWRTPCAS